MRKNIFFGLIILAILISILACGDGGSSEAPLVTVTIGAAFTAPASEASPAVEASQTAIPMYNTNNEELIFAGKVVNPDTGEWPNDRLVLLFLKTQEIARTVTSTGEFDAIKRGIVFESVNGGLGVIDGLFVFHIPNTYKLTILSLGIDPREQPFVEAYYLPGGIFSSTDVLAAWFDPFYEGDSREIFIPSKNIRYTVVVLKGPVAELPAEIQQPGSTELRSGNRLVAVNPAAANSTPQPRPVADGSVKFLDTVEEIQEFDPLRFPLNNCGGSADLVQRYTKTYVHKIIDESMSRLGIEVPILDWLKVVAEVERRYGIEQGQITTFDTLLTVPAGQFAEYIIIRKQVWETGMAEFPSGSTLVSVPYRVLKDEIYEVSAPEQKTCP